MMTLTTDLVLGYGNPLRCDDGVGQAIAAQIARWNLPHVRSRPLHQLTPELSETLSKVQRAFFIDARLVNDTQTGIHIEPVRDAIITQALGHSLTPRSLLGMTQWLYGNAPQAWLISIPGECFDLGDRLSPQTQAHLEDVLTLMQTWLNSDLDFAPHLQPSSSICA